MRLCFFGFRRFFAVFVVLVLHGLLAACAVTPDAGHQAFVVGKPAAAPSGYTAYINSRAVIADQKPVEKTAGSELSPSS